MSLIPGALGRSSAGVVGRMTTSDATVTIFGASGFLGRYVANCIGRCGATMFTPTRGCDMDVRHLKPLADYGKITPKFISFDDEDSLRDAMKHSNVVVNLIGKRYATSHYLPWLINNSIEDSNLHTARTISRLAKETGVDHLVHVSALGCSADSASEWSRAKAASEDAVLAEFEEATIVRPASMYGSEDRFLNTFASFAKLLPAFPLMENGQARQQPVFVADVGEAIARIVLNSEECANTTYNLAGEEIYTVKELTEFTYESTQRQANMVDVPNAALEAVGRAVEAGFSPWVTADEFRLLREDAVLGDTPNGFASLGISPVSFEVKAPLYLGRYKPGGQFKEISQA